ncbi:37S ribosomal protein Rsm22 [Moelleriella libera RCEF 2490]|uniref:37S ribosomal protein Rsm22 n=1 Tax=Moelleriella libera RCEF 2490 TaxID=1081109 RepID=A0A168DGM5_9HYPO|nr:37S ribosomal protein Rsm22 [Moelleriella libera RCEF 2490]
MSSVKGIGRIPGNTARLLLNNGAFNITLERPFTLSRRFALGIASETQAQSTENLEKIVRDAKQRFRDTLPRGYLNDEEFALYERLYGSPLRETAPEDVGIPMHVNLDSDTMTSSKQGVLLRPQADGVFQAVKYETERQLKGERNMPALPMNSTEDSERNIVEETAGYVDIVARSQREHDALRKLAQDYEAAQKTIIRDEDGTADKTIDESESDSDDLMNWLPEIAQEQGGKEYRESKELQRYHPVTLKGRFHDSPIELSLPMDELISPIRELLERTHVKHVKQAAERSFGGPGLPISPSTPQGMKNGRMGGIGLPPDQRHMTEIEADAFLAGYLPPACASIMSILREVRKRIGSQWIQSRLKQGQNKALSVLDAGSGGAGLIAWDRILNAEWTVMEDQGDVEGTQPSGQKTVIVSSDKLRHRLKSFLHNTTFLPRLPDYEHSGHMRGVHLDAGKNPQPRKSFDIIIASHLFLKEKQEHFRQAVLNNLWSLLNEDGGVLIIVEKAHPRGFEAVAQVRDTILNQFLSPQTGETSVLSSEDFNPAFHRKREDGYIIAPCPGHGPCPMYTEPGKSKGRKDYCHFSQRFVQPQFYSQMFGKHANNQGEVEFSYVAVRRGVSKKSQATGIEATREAFAGYEHAKEAPDMQTLPRLVLPPLKRKGHVTLDVCTPGGDIERWTVPKSFSKLAYHDARKSRWGDLWALGAKTRVLRKVRSGSGPQRVSNLAATVRDEQNFTNLNLSPGDKNSVFRNRDPGVRVVQRHTTMKEFLDAEARLEAALDEELDHEAEAELAEEDAEGDVRTRRAL